jgi:hypothetical protein
MHWDQETAAKLRQLGLNQEQIGVIIGIIAEYRQNMDRQGYIRGYNDGFENRERQIEFIDTYLGRKSPCPAFDNEIISEDICKNG